MIRSIGNYGRGLRSPSMYEMRTWILKGEVETTDEIVNDIRATWKETGVSLLSDGWSDIRNRSLINFLVNNRHGTVFLKTVDASDCVKDAKKLFQLLDNVIEEIGGEIVIQVVTDNASAYKAAGKLLMEKRQSLYWTPCAAHCIHLMLEKIGELPQQKNALLKAKKVTNFIHNHRWVLSLTRKFAKKDLLRPAATRFATDVLTLESIYQLKTPLQMMFVSNEWAGCAWAKKPEGKAVKKIIMDERVFWPSVVYSLKTTQPLIHVLRIVDADSPAMGIIYGAMDEAKEKISKNLEGDLSKYKEIWEIIDTKWELQLHRDLHAAAYFLNPRFRYSSNVFEYPEIRRGLLKCMDRLVKNESTFMKIDSQLDAYSNKEGLFGFKSALASYKTRQPVQWWDNFGDDVPELKLFATRILGLTCSASACERNWSTFNQVHSKRRNRLTVKRMNKLVYIMYNKKLKLKFLKKKNQEVKDPLLLENVSSDEEWTENPNNEDLEEMEEMQTDEEIVNLENNFEDERDQPSTSKKRKNVVNLEDEDEGEDSDSYDYGYDGGAFTIDV